MDGFVSFLFDHPVAEFFVIVCCVCWAMTLSVLAAGVYVVCRYPVKRAIRKMINRWQTRRFAAGIVGHISDD